MFDQFLKILNPINLLDIAIVAFVIYKLMMILKGTRAVQLIKGLVVLLIATVASEILGLKSINWLLEKAQTVFFIAIPIVFQPELRRALEQLGRGKLFVRSGYLAQEDVDKLVNEIVRAIKVMAKKKIGALVVIERQTGLADFVETGIKIDGFVTSELLINTFVPKTPLHDGAVIIRGDRLLAASCFLPLSENPNLSKELGTRHRAAVGVTEVSDALVVMVSEETGVISVAEDGKLTRYLDEITLKELLLNRIEPQQKSTHFWNWRS
ncbi:MAG: diadenylate cyclase [Clostridia bacterium]|nr:diadenylate cyclase [Clostridia bacterium]MDN5323627.1 diadenylate cyclase [Clostridia bacterium]